MTAIYSSPTLIVSSRIVRWFLTIIYADFREDQSRQIQNVSIHGLDFVRSVGMAVIWSVLNDFFGDLPLSRTIIRAKFCEENWSNKKKLHTRICI